MRERAAATGLLVTSGGALAWLGPSAPSSVHVLAGPDFAAALEALVASALVATAGWGTLVATLSLLAPRAAWAARALTRLAPRAARHLLVGTAVGAGLVVPAAASASTGVDGLPYPDRPTGGTAVAATDAPVVRARPVVAPVRHVVRQGDTLWSIAASHLPASAGPLDVARATRRWHTANRDVVGDDPDLIQPGQRLRPPTKDTP